MLTEAEFRQLAAEVDRSRAWGADDERGALNFLSPHASLAALHDVQRGEVVSCADRLLGARGRITTVRTEGLSWLAVDESVTLEQHGSTSMTHFDALGHFFYDGRGHAGIRPLVVKEDGLDRLDVVPASAGIVGRGVLLDLPAIAGTEYVATDTLVSLEQVHRWLREVGITMQSGDMLFIRMGRPLAGAPPAGEYPQVGGPALECARWVFEEEVSLIVTDAGLDTPTQQVENVATPWHVLALTRMGVSLVDMADLEGLAQACSTAGRYSFLAIVAVAPIRRASGFPANPLAVF